MGSLPEATVEAAMLIPAFLLLLLLMLQPVCLLYTRSVMESTAAETARLLATGDADATRRTGLLPCVDSPPSPISRFSCGRSARMGHRAHAGAGRGRRGRGGDRGRGLSPAHLGGVCRNDGGDERAGGHFDARERFV